MIKQKNDSIINASYKESKNNKTNNTSSDNLSQKTFKINERKISENPRSILKFYRDNKSIIKLNENDFKEWLNNNYMARRYNKKFIATENAVEKGYMVNSTKAIIDLDKLTCVINYGAQITPKGQNFILDCFEEVENER